MERPKLDPEFKQKWVEALRSGKFKQGTGVLYNPETKGYCCIGVAGEILGVELQNRHINALGACSLGGLYTDDSCPDFFNYNRNEDTLDILVDMNDMESKSFSQIADYIEANL